MLTARLRLIEFLDALPLGACTARARVRVIPLFLTREFLPPVEGGPPPPPGPPPSVEVLKPDYALAGVVESETTTDAEGRGVVTLSLDAEVARVQALRRSDGRAPDGISFDQSFAAEVFSVLLHWTRPDVVDLNADITVDRLIVIDVAKSIVGDVSDKHATLWFQLHGPPRSGDAFICELRPVGANLPIVRHPIRLDDAARVMSGTTIFLGLREKTLYAYLLIVRTHTGEEHILTQGRSAKTTQSGGTMTPAVASSCAGRAPLGRGHRSEFGQSPERAA